MNEINGKKNVEQKKTQKNLKQKMKNYNKEWKIENKELQPTIIIKSYVKNAIKERENTVCVFFNSIIFVACNFSSWGSGQWQCIVFEA